jgi:hypothetical protein
MNDKISKPAPGNNVADADGFVTAAVPQEERHATWDWNTEGDVIVGLLRNVKQQTTKYEGDKRTKTLAIVDVETSSGEVEGRAVWLPASWLAEMRKHPGKIVRITRASDGTAAGTSYDLAYKAGPQKRPAPAAKRK